MVCGTDDHGGGKGRKAGRQFRERSFPDTRPPPPSSSQGLSTCFGCWLYEEENSCTYCWHSIYSAEYPMACRGDETLANFLSQNNDY